MIIRKIFGRYSFKKWKKNYPSNILEYLYSPASIEMKIVNFIFQKIFRLNQSMKFMVHFTSTVYGDITLGRNVVKSFARSGGCYIQGINGIIIGDNTIFAPGVKIISANHLKGGVKGHTKDKPVKIGKDCWIAANAVILPGVELGDRVVVGAGSVVTKSFENDAVIAGVPARIINKKN